MRTKQPRHDCHCGNPDDCGYIATERNRYFTGKYMAARDFQNEQDYFLSRHRLHNRLLHGWGIVCGLKVTPHPNPDCANRWVVIHPGIAIDCCGRELIIECETPFQLPLSDAPTNCGDDESTAQTGAPSADSEGNYSERP